jgi:hypothetical protein
LDDQEIEAGTRALLNLARSDEERSALEEGFALLPRHRTRPAFASLRIDRSGNLWVEEHPAVDSGSELGVWRVFDRSGVAAARVELPVGLGLLEIGDDYVLGLIQDHRPDERIVMYRLTRSTGP